MKKGRSAKYVPSPDTIRRKRVQKKLKESTIKRGELVMSKRMKSIRNREEALTSAFQRLRTARTRRQTEETVNALAERLGRIRIESSQRPTLTPNQVRSFYAVARPHIRRAIRSMISNTRSLTGPNVNAGAHGSTWHHLPSRITLSQAARRHYSPSRVNQGLFDPNQFAVIYGIANNAKKRQYNNAVQRVINRFKAPGNVFEGNTPSKYRTMYGRVDDVQKFSRAFRNWQTASSENKNAKFSNLIQKLRRVKVLQAHELLNFNNSISNYHGVLPNAVKRLFPLSNIRINRQTGAWNKTKVERALRAIHAVQKLRRT